MNVFKDIVLKGRRFETLSDAMKSSYEMYCAIEGVISNTNLSDEYQMRNLLLTINLAFDAGRYVGRHELQDEES